MRKKTLNPCMINYDVLFTLLDTFTTALKVPGPGQYQHLPGITPNGVYPLSKFRNSCTRLINPQCSTRFPKRRKARAPGPGNYSREK